jgi:hypothetical protein
MMANAIDAGRRVQRRFIGVVGRVAGGMTQAMAVGMQGDVGPIRMIKRGCGGLELLGRIPRSGWRPDIPHEFGEAAAIAADGLFAALRGHEPVVPVVAGHFQRDGLAGAVGAISDREHGEMAGYAGTQAAGIGRGARAPVVADQGWLPQIQRIDEVQHIATQSRQLPGPHPARIVESGRRKAAHRRHQHPPPHIRQPPGNAIPGAHAIRPTVYQYRSARP